MNIPYFVVDAFTDKAFGGNPAGVCPLEKWLSDDTMQRIAAENNLSETAFFVREGDDYHLRWFTPLTEIELCGHATVASAFVLFSELGYRGNTVRFQSRTGLLVVHRENDLFVLDFPSRPPIPCDAPETLLHALSRKPVEVLRAFDYLVVYPSADDVRALQPDLAALRTLENVRAVIVTAPGADCDFVSRFFAPKVGVPEDPVTGSAHCTLIPYWSQRLGKTKLFARQLSRRGGELFCEAAGGRVRIGGNAVLYLRGRIEINEGR